MGAYGLAPAMVALLVFAPMVAASDPFRSQVCLDDTHCYGFGSCVDAVCIPPSCAPLAQCRGDVGPGTTSCAENATIDGRTCQSYVGVGAHDERELLLPGYGDASGQGAWVALSLSNGSVHEEKLPNTWISPGAEADVRLLGVEPGGVSAGVYRSDIVDDGARGGPFGMVAPSQNHTWTELGVYVRREGGQETLVAIWLLDLMPDGCFARVPDPAIGELHCPPLHELYP